MRLVKNNYLKKIERGLKDEMKDSSYDLSALQQTARDFARTRAVRNYRTAEQFIRQVRLRNTLKKK